MATAILEDRWSRTDLVAVMVHNAHAKKGLRIGHFNPYKTSAKVKPEDLPRAPLKSLKALVLGEVKEWR